MLRQLAATVAGLTATTQPGSWRRGGCQLLLADAFIAAAPAHHNDDRLGGIHRGADTIIAYLTESTLLTAGTLHAEPQSVMADGQGHVAVLVRLSASRPDGPTMDGPQVVLVTVEGGRVRAIEQFVSDPAAVAAFWA
jgi:ketosteroid isomerase-like protein